VVPSAAIGAVPPPPTEIERTLNRLQADLKRLEGEYNMFFAGRLRKPPWDTRSRVEALVKQIDHTPIQNFGDRFRFTTLQTRLSKFIDLWDRGMRAREEGRPGPFMQQKSDKAEQPGRVQDRILCVASFHDPMKEMDKLHDLYDSLVEARREVGSEAVPFHRFADLVKTQVEKLKAAGSPEIAFRVSLKDGKVNFTARALRGASDD
jgi:hypothetical protein